MRANVDLRFELPKRASAESGRTTGVLALLNGTAPVAPQEKEITQWAREAAEGSPQAQYELARALASGATLSADNRTAVKWLKKAAEKEHLASRHLLGVLIARGQGIRPVPAKAAELFRSAAVMGFRDAQYDLARCYLWGFGVEPSEKEALTWFRLAAAQGHTEAEYESAKAYAEGRGTAPDLKQAQQRYKRAAMKGCAPAAYELALLNLRPDNPQKDNDEAFRWCAEAARAGLSDAQLALAFFYWAGRGVKKSAAQALKWSVLAARAGSLKALLFASKLLFEEAGVSAAKRERALSLVTYAKRKAADAKDAPLLSEAALRETELTGALSETEVRHAAAAAQDALAEGRPDRLIEGLA